MHMLKNDLQCDDNREWDVWEVLEGHEDGILMNGISAFIRGSSLPPSTR